jgi:hypothetical protein
MHVGTAPKFNYECKDLARQRGIMATVSANGTENRGFESRQCTKFLDLIHFNAVLCNLIRNDIMYVWVK